MSVVLAATSAVLAARFAGMPVTEFASGVTLSMMGPFLMREPTLRQRARTLLLLLLPACAAVLLTALLHGHGPAGDGVFLLAVFVGFLFHPRSPRMIGIGLVGIVTTYVGLFLELPPATLPVQILALLAAAPIVAFACFVAVPINPARTLRRTIQAVQWRAAHVLHSADRLARAGANTARLAKALRRDLVRLNEAALAADDQLAFVGTEGRDDLRAGLIDLELATGRLIGALREETPGPRHAARLHLHERRIRRGDPYSLAASKLEQGSLLAALVDLGHAVHALGATARHMIPARSSTPPRALPPGPLAWRLAAQTTLAAAIAMAGGMALSPNRWFWAVITVYVVFLNARSRGDTIYKGLQRLGGTLLGMASGLVLAELLVRHQDLQILALLVSIFAMFYVFLVSYTAGILCVTVMLGLLYGMLGAPLESLLVLRLEETAIGAAAGIFVAAFVLPTRTRHQVMRSGRAVLTALAEAVGASRKALAAQDGPSAAEMMRRVDRQVVDLRLAMAPLTAGRAIMRRDVLERPVPALLECVHWARVLAATAHGPLPASCTDVLVSRAAGIEARLARLAETSSEAVVRGPRAPSQAPDEPARGQPTGERELALNQLDLAVRRLEARIEIGALEGFSLGS